MSATLVNAASKIFPLAGLLASVGFILSLTLFV